jgi:hypothetical protein
MAIKNSSSNLQGCDEQGVFGCLKEEAIARMTISDLIEVNHAA